MDSEKIENGLTCSHCGDDNVISPDVWLNRMDGGDPVRCRSCKNPLVDRQYPDSHGSTGKGTRNFSIAFFIIVFFLSGLLIYLNRVFGVLTFKEHPGQIVYEIMLILIVSSALASGKIRQNLKYLGIWAAIFMVLIAGYSYRIELYAAKEKILAELIPAKGFQNEPGAVSFPVASDGHFYINAEVNGVPVMFLADTGASHIVLSPIDARKLGIQTDQLTFDRFYETANGTVRGASIRIDDFKVGDIHLEAIGASVNEAEMRNSLLGMTFFKRLDSYGVKNDHLTLYWHD